jgi:ribosomal-protein-alanine N-acetyltransferase
VGNKLITSRMLTVSFEPFPIIETARLLLRKFEYTDSASLLLLRSHPSVMRYIDRPPMKTLEESDAMVKRILDSLAGNDGITWAITLRGQPGIIGTIGFWRIMHEHHRAEIGYMISPDQQGTGLMQEAMTPILDYGFQKMKLHSVEAHVNPANKASIGILEKNKFVREAYYHENYYYNGRFLDSAIYSLLERYR